MTTDNDTRMTVPIKSDRLWEMLTLGDDWAGYCAMQAMTSSRQIDDLATLLSQSVKVKEVNSITKCGENFRIPNRE